MPKVKANGIDIEYDVFGRDTDPAILLIMGLGAQMIWWDEDFCLKLADLGLYVIRFDNRDVGLSTLFNDEGIPNLKALMMAAWGGKPFEAPYTLDDMTADAIGLMDALGLEKAHFCGASMGGMIAQTAAIQYPERVLSLISIMSTTGNPKLPAPEPAAGKFLMTRVPKERDPYIEYGVELWRTLSGDALPFDEKEIRRKVAESYDRCFCPQGTARQTAAIMTSGNRKPALKNLELPTLVIHGDQDPLVPLAGGIDTAEAVSGSKLVVIEGMGHDLPRAVWPEIIESIEELVKG